MEASVYRATFRGNSDVGDVDMLENKNVKALDNVLPKISYSEDGTKRKIFPIIRFLL